MRQADGQLQSVIRQASENSSQVIESSSQNIFFCTRIEGASLDWNLIKVAPKSYVYADARIFFLNSLLLLGLWHDHHHGALLHEYHPVYGSAEKAHPVHGLHRKGEFNRTHVRPI